MVIAVGAILSVSLADTYFIGQIGTEELAAISFTFPVVLTVTSLGIGLSAGAASVASRAIGRGDASGAERQATDSLILSFLVVAVVSAVGWLVSRPLFALLGASGDVLDLVVEYMRVWFLGIPVLVVPMVAMGLIRANGDTLAPSAIMVFGSVINILLDPIFIFGAAFVPELGVAGAAWATLIARLVTLVATIALLIFRERLICFDLPSLEVFLQSSSKVLKVGIPAAGSNMINPLSISVVTAILASYGNEAVAAFGVATRVEVLATIPMLALSSAIGPVAGQNWGSGKPDRTGRAMRDAFLFVILCGLVLGAGFFVIAEPVVALFSDDTAVQNLAISYLLFVGITLGGYGIVINASAAYNAIDMALIGLVFTVLRSFVLYVPLVLVATMFGPPWLAFGGIAAANVVSGLLVAMLAFVILRRRKTEAAA